MIRFPQEQDMIYLDAEFTMSAKAMSALLYGALMAKAHLRNSFMMDYNYTRSQNSRNRAYMKVFIHPENIATFEEHAGIKLKEPIKIQMT